MSQRSFDYPAFLTDWRALCRRYGVDPLEGFSTYQLIHYRVDQGRCGQNSDWWKDHHLWSMTDDDQPREAAQDRGVLYSSAVEQAAIFNSFATTYAMAVERLNYKPTERVQPQEVKRSCPHCGAGDSFQHFWRSNSSGKQYLCTFCNRVYSPERGKPIYSEDRKEMAYALYQEGVSNYVIAERLHIHRITVSEWLKEFDVVRPSTRQQYPKELRDHVFQLHSEGWTSRQIERELGINARLVRSWVSKVSSAAPNAS